MSKKYEIEIKPRAIKDIVLNCGRTPTGEEETFMVELHPRFLEKDGKTEFVVLPVEDYENLRAYLEDLEDLLELRRAIHEEQDVPGLSLEEARKELGLVP